MMEYKFAKNILLDKAIELGYNPGEISNKKILVIRDLETALMYAPENIVVYVTDDVVAFNKFKMFTKVGCGNDDSAILMDGNEFKYIRRGETEITNTHVLKIWENIETILNFL